MTAPALHEQTIRVNGIDMHVATGGAGQPVLLLHGFPDTHKVWARQVGALVSAGYHVIAPDLRGYGLSEAPDSVASYGIAILRTDITSLLDALEIDKACVVGHDWGAMVGWQLCMYAPERVERFAALSVGHPNAYTSAGAVQKLKAWYALLFQLPGIAETMVGAADLLALKPYAADASQLDEWRRNLKRPGRMTAALNYYRANRQLATTRPYPPVLLSRTCAHVRSVLFLSRIVLQTAFVSDRRHFPACAWQHARRSAAHRCTASHG